MPRDYSTEELARKIDDPDERFYLIDTLQPESYSHRHLPGAISLPLEKVREKAASVLPEKDAEIVAYCGSPT